MNTQVEAPIRKRRRTPKLAAIAAALAVGITLAAGTTANAAVPGSMNPALTRVTAVSGTNCAVHVSMWLNAYRYPGAGAYVTCSSNHTISIAVETDWAPVSGGSWYLWGKSGNTSAGYGTRSSTIYETWTVLGGQRQWRGVAHVWIDGVYRGWAPSEKGTWTAGT